MRVLLVCPDSPYPPRDGGSLRIVNMVRSLARHVSVMLLTYVVSPAETEALAEFGKKSGVRVCGVPRPARRNAWTRAWHKLRYYYGAYLFSTTPGAVRFNRQPVMRDALRSALQDFAPDVIIWEYWFMTGFAEMANTACPRTIQLTDVVDLEWLRLEREGGTVHGLTKRWIQHLQPRIRRYTLDQYRRMTDVLFLSTTDAHLAQHDLPDFDRGLVIPMGLMLDEYPTPIAPPRPDRVLFFGSFRHQPNVDALRFLLQDVWPRILQARPQATLDLMGTGIPTWARQLAQQLSGIRVLGFQPDIRPALAEASVVIAPLRFGSGVKIKILESMALGKAVVTTPIGAEGIKAEAGTEFIVVDDAQSLAAETVRLLASPALCDTIGRRARQFIETHHDADEIAKYFLDRLNEFGVHR